MLRTSILCSAAVSLAVTLTAQVRPFGDGCPGPFSATPVITASGPLVAGSSVVQLRFDALAAHAPFLMVVGASNQTWSGATLPLDVGKLGFPGCFLNVGYDGAFGLLSDASGKAFLPIQTASLAGLRLYAQLIVPDPNGPRLAASQGYELTIQKSVPQFGVYVLPDTQFYVRSTINNARFLAQTEWIVNHHAADNGVFVSHVGDMVEVGASGPLNNQAQWDRAAAAMDKLDGDLKVNPDGVIPYSTAVGNRDFDTVDVKTTAVQFDTYFGPSRYAGRSWFKGQAPNGRSTYQIFTANSEQFLHLAVEWRGDDDVLAWARNVLTAHPDLPAILTTHQYLGSGGKGIGVDDSGSTLNTGGDNGGLGIREKLVEPFPQIFMVLCGHNIAAGQAAHTTVLAQTVHQLLMDYSFDPYGGNGWMHQLVCSPDRGEIESICFSPTYRPGIDPGVDRRSRTDSNYKLPFDFHEHRRRLEATRAAHFTGDYDHGFGKYTGALDTFVSSIAATSAYGSAADVEIKHPVGTDQQQGLVKFGGIFGAAAGQIPAGKRIAAAILTLTTEGVGATSTASSGIYRLRVPFDENATWSSLGGGIVVGTDTEATPDSTTGNRVSIEGTRSFDVTASVRAWQGGAANHGWAIVTGGTDSWSFRSQDWGSATERPMLTVIYER